jgi:YHS domain-containing protein
MPMAEIMDISKAEKADYKGKMFYFCSTSCKDKFLQEPEKYTKKDNGKGHDNREHHHQK